VRRLLQAAFTLDLRSLAACRILAGIIMLVDAVVRASEFRLFHTELGILPRLALLEINPTESFPNLHLLSDLVEYKALMLVLHGLLGCFLCLGYRTRIVTVLCWYSQHCLMTSNYLVNNGGDAVLCCLLFWAMFVPWGTCASLDALAAPPDQTRPTSVFSAGTVCLIGQMLLIYWVSVVHKMEPTWLSGKAVYYALQSDLYSRPTRVLLLPHREFLQALTYLTLVWEVFGTLLLIAPWPRLRWCGLIPFSFMHLSFGYFLRLGIFAFSPQLNFVALIPGTFWARWPDFPRLRAWGESLNRRLKTPPPQNRSLSLETSAALGALLFYSVLQGLGNKNLRHYSNPLIPSYLRWVGSWTGLNQRWAVFVNLPGLLDGWVLVEGQLSDGSLVDLFQERDPFRWDKPVEVSEVHTHFRWPTPLVTIVSEPALPGWFLQSMVWNWNARHPQRKVIRARMYMMKEPTLAEYQDSPPITTLVREWRAP